MLCGLVIWLGYMVWWAMLCCEIDGLVGDAVGLVGDLGPVAARFGCCVVFCLVVLVELLVLWLYIGFRVCLLLRFVVVMVLFPFGFRVPTVSWCCCGLFVFWCGFGKLRFVG